MKNILATLIMSLWALGSFAYNKAEIKVSYTSISPNMRNGKVDVKNQYILLANSMESKFYSPMTEYIDSLNSTPEGKSKYQEITRNAYLGGKLDEMPQKDGSYYILKSYPEKTLMYYDSAGLDKFFYEETPEEWNWETGDSTMDILGYECIEAFTEFHGRRWTAWFSPEIPVHNGPWKFDGLPGLILKAEAEGGEYSFEATGVAESDKPITPVYLAKEYEKTSRVNFLRDKRAFIDNTLSRLNAQLGDISAYELEDENGNKITGSIFVSRDTVDFIETDY